MTTTNAPSGIPDLTDPVCTIEHVARCFHLSVDTAREYTARDDSSRARRLSASGGRLLWLREDVLAWFAKLPAVPAALRRRGRADAGAADRPAAILAKPGAYKPAHRRRSRRLGTNGGAG